MNPVKTSNTSGLVLHEIGSILEYLIDRGETEVITSSEPACRYKKAKPIEKLLLTTDAGTYEITATKVK